ncbi:hypothetical protein [uncultured Pelagimonas sp.]|uniref:hypothetical protein n=1 Tax=uncultured Pelagimonas sp. TaxID=1618102 RepID=UPI002624C9F2|nr:hypothetical protein [uncultured Pelagimonas sp.]
MRRSIQCRARPHALNMAIQLITPMGRLVSFVCPVSRYDTAVTRVISNPLLRILMRRFPIHHWFMTT